jgi:RNA polymerase sigma factor (sigma-70 family)
MTAKSERAAEAGALESGRRQNLARGLISPDLAVRREAEERLPELIGAALKAAMVLLGNREDAEDVVSTALEKWLRNPGRYNPNFGVSDVTWFKTVVRHTAIDHLRNRYFVLPPPPAVRQSYLAWAGSVDDDRVLHPSRGTRRVEHAEQATEQDEAASDVVETLYAAIAALPEPDQRVLREYLSWDDPPDVSRLGHRLGNVLGVSEKIARARFVAASAALRREVLRLMETPVRRGETDPQGASMDGLTAEFDAMLERMQQPQVQAGIEAGMAASPAELAQAFAIARRYGG